MVNTGGEIREIPCLEFYGGMIVDDCVRQHIQWVPGDPIREKILQLYRENGACGNSLALIQGVDFTRFIWMPESRIVYLR